MVLIVLFVFSLFVIFLWRDSRKPKGFPPGPRWLPVVGCIPLLQRLVEIFKCHHLMWQHFSVRCGPVAGFRIGHDKLIVISGKDAIKEFYSREEFSARPNGFFFRIRSFNKRLGIVFTDGRLWEIQRKFAMKTMKQLRNNQNDGFSHVELEAQHMVECFESMSEAGQPIEMEHLFDVPVLNVMWKLLAGYRFNVDDEHLRMLLKMIHENFRVVDMSGGLLNQFPFIRHIFPGKSGYKKLLQTTIPVWKFLRDTIADIQANIGEKNEIATSLISEFLIEIEKCRGQSSSTFTADQLLVMCLDFFQAGSETTSNTMSFGIIYMLHNPSVLAKVRAELDRIVGRRNVPCLNDRSNLQYTEAVLCEIQRFASVAPLAIAHRTAETVKFCGYIIPKDTIALVSLYSLNMDANLWLEPKRFSPERFLDNNGKLIQHEHFIPFGLGKRRCIGETLVKSSLFLFFTAFVQRFDVMMPPGSGLPDTEPVDGITLSPRPYTAFLMKRC